MEAKLKWKKKLFSNLYRIYFNDQQIGILKDNVFTQISNGELNGEKFTFRTKGLFKQNTEITDSSNNKVIGRITYNNWMNKATISLNDKMHEWKYDNIWTTKWSIFDTEGTNIAYAGTQSKGQIDSNTDNSLLVLSGLFVTHYYWHITTIVIIAVLVPIFTTILR